MKKPSPLAQAAGFISGTAVFVLLYLAFRYGPHLYGQMKSGGIPAPIALVLVPLVPILLAGMLLKWGLVRAIPTEFGFQAVHPASYPKLNTEAFTRYNDALMGMGFVWVIDYTLTSGTVALPAFARLLVHPVHHCFAEVNQAFPEAGGLQPVRCVFGSLLQDGWSFGTTDRKPDGTTWMLRRPKSLWSSCPAASPEVMLQSHLERRARIASQLGINPRTDLTFDTYFVHEQAEARDRVEVMKRRNIFVALGDALIFNLWRRYEWMGALEKGARS